MRIVISLKIFIIAILSFAILSMFIIIIVQNHKLNRDINKETKTISPDVNATSENFLKTNTTPLNTEISSKRRLQYEKTITQLKSQINNINNGNINKANKKLNSDGMVGKGQEFKPVKEADMLSDEHSVIVEDFEKFYKPFFNNLHLSTETIEKLKHLYEQHLMSISNNLYDARDVSTGDAQKIELYNQNELISDNYNNTISDILGKDNYEKYKMFEETISERRMVEDITLYISAANPLDDNQENALILAFYQDRKEIDDLYPKEQYQKLFDLSISDKETEEKLINSLLNKITYLNDKYLNSAQNILTEAQLMGFEYYLKNQSSTEERKLRATINALKESAGKSGNQ